MKRSIFLLLCASIGLAATAQTINKERLIDECQRLYSDGEYTTALSLLEKLDITKLDKEKRQEAELLIALNTYENDALAGRSLMLQYLADYPESAQRELLDCYIAQSYYHSGEYKKACNWFGQCELKALTPKQRDEAMLYYALSLLNSGNEGAAENLLINLSLTSKEYATDATFHIAVINYNRDNLNEAYEGFKLVELNDKYYLEAPYYIAGIFIKKGEYDRALNIAGHFIEDHGAKVQGIRMRQIQGAAHFMQGDYDKAAEALATYMNNYHSPQRIAMYQLGKSLYELENHDEAIKMFTICADGDDAIAQNSLLHLGFIHLDNEDAKSARLAFGRAAEMRHDDRVREEALYNYAMCIHATNYSPFGESVKTFEQFLNDYPKSKHADKVGEFLVEEYTNTRNYEIALQSINKINNPSAKILEAKQKMLYRMGAQEFVNGNMEGTINYMNQSLELGRYDSKTKGSAHFWKGEALFRKGDITGARRSYSQALTADENGNRKAMYGIGYTYFKEGKYNEARAEFERFSKVASKEGYDLLADTYCRIADCYFYQRNFDQAENYYTKGINTYKANADYPLFRLAQIQGLKNNNEASIGTLKTLVINYESSPYTEQALYELGRTFIKQEKYREAISVYNRLIATFPHSETSRRASAERAMIYNTIGDRENAIAAYKDIIALYPNSEEAQVAMQDLKSIYVDMGRVDLYAEYANGRGEGQRINSSEIDTLAYTAAEKVYGRGDLDGARIAFDEYLKNHPEGAFRVNSYYFKGMINYSQENEEEALACFAEVFNYPDNKYREEAMVLAAEIHYGRMDFENATALYKQIAAQSKDEERRNTALTRVLHAAIEQNEHNEIVQCATMIENNSNMSPEFKREAVFSRAKAHLALGNNDQALEDLDQLAEDTRTKEGAEAKYLVAQLLFDEQSYDFCEDEINDFIEMSTPHTYWMARCFILLADLYTVQGKTMEAKQYLLSLQNNYIGEDDIAEMITDRLTRLSNEN
ncbi:MAG: tetratricopeptide repeat protein [Bacteroidaceae bacterium]|nr:tetratricopeptide repeat protein [Bacteroidaceae bacterium]